MRIVLFPDAALPFAFPHIIMEEMINPFEKEYLSLSLHTLRGILPCAPEVLLRRYEEDDTGWSLEVIDDLVYCLFAFPVLSRTERICLLVYNRAKEIIADLGAYHTSARAFLEDAELYDYLSRESDWMYLEHYVLSNTVFDSYPYPFCKTKQTAEEDGEVLLYINAYVSEDDRRRGIFRNMIETVSEFALRDSFGIATLSSVMSMDPDIACYGPDTKEEPYYYSFETDEPLRKRNAEIAVKLGMNPVRLEPEIPENETDGTKLWFCYGKELFEIIEADIKA